MRIKLLIMDVDGTLTDGKIYIGAQGEVMKAFHIQDGYGIAHILPNHGIIPVIITGRESEIVKKRAQELGIAELHQNISDKLTQMKLTAQKYGAGFKEIAYIGDDLLDLPPMQAVKADGGYTACPADAVKEIKEAVDYICVNPGGCGAVREFMERILEINGK